MKGLQITSFQTVLVEKILSLEKKRLFRACRNCSMFQKMREGRRKNKECEWDADTFRKCGKNPSNTGDLEGLSQLVILSIPQNVWSKGLEIYISSLRK